MFIILVTTDTLLSNIPKLDIKETNWMIFNFCFQVTIKAKELWGHLDGWMAKHLLAQQIPDLPGMQVQKKVTVVEMWKEITKEYTEKGVYAQMDLCMQFFGLRLAKRADV